MLNSITVAAPAKINLSLDIVDSGDDDYHLMQTVMQTVDLEDKITIKKNELGGIRLFCDNAAVPVGAENIAFKAAELFLEELEIEDHGIDITLEKEIPVAAGLAGGSADAAGVLLGLNELYQTELSTSELCSIALDLGSDVPFCISGGTQLADGAGEIFTPLPTLSDCYFVIAKPAESMSTQIAFRLFDKIGCTVKPDTDTIIAGIVAQNLGVVAECLSNVLESVIATEVPDVLKLKNLFLEFEALGASMTGSGTAVFGLFENKSKAKKCQRELEEYYSDVFLVAPTSFGARVVEVNNRNNC